MFRFTIRDVLWLTVLVALLIAWRIERGKSNALSRERDEAIARWRAASDKWLQATKLIRPSYRDGAVGGGSAATLPTSENDTP